MDQKKMAKGKKEILEAAKKIFVMKGFSKTTMEDVIAETSLSKGGVYYHYKSTKDMIFDMFMEGNEQRIAIIKRYIADNQLSEKDLEDEDVVAEMMVEKILTVSPLMEIYAQFLIETAYNDELRQTYYEIVKQSLEDMSKIFSSESDADVDERQRERDFIMNMMNIFILGSNVLKVHESFVHNRILIKEMLKLAIRSFRK